jgi:hypothetical protein
MRSMPALYFRAFALATIVGAAAAGPPACSIIDSASECQSACNALVQCGVIQSSDCGGYCASAVSTATYTGCTDQLNAQNTCAQTSAQCDAPSPTTCSMEVEAFTMCVTNHRTMDPNSDGCPITSGDGGVEGGGGGGGPVTGDGG